MPPQGTSDIVLSKTLFLLMSVDTTLNYHVGRFPCSPGCSLTLLCYWLEFFCLRDLCREQAAFALCYEKGFLARPGSYFCPVLNHFQMRTSQPSSLGCVQSI